MKKTKKDILHQGELFNTITNFGVNLTMLASFIATFANATSTIVQSEEADWLFVLQVLWDNAKDFFTVIFILAFFLLLKIRKAAVKEVDLEVFLSDINEDFAQEMTKQIARIHSIAQCTPFSDRKQSEDVYLLTLDAEQRTLADTLEPALTSISKYLSKRYNTHTSTCIKVFSGKDRHLPVEERQLCTLARCLNSSKRRRKQRNRKNQLKYNSDFKEILSLQKAFFSSCSLQEEFRSDRYLTDSEHFLKEPYESTIVVPISTYLSKSLASQSSEIEHHTLGFLCIDSKEKIESWTDPESLALMLLSFMANMFFGYLYTFHHLLDNPQQKEEDSHDKKTFQTADI